MTPTEIVVQKPVQVYAAGESPPPQLSIPLQLAEELAEILADALVEDFRNFPDARTPESESQCAEALAAAQVTAMNDQTTPEYKSEHADWTPQFRGRLERETYSCRTTCKPTEPDASGVRESK